MKHIFSIIFLLIGCGLVAASGDDPVMNLTDNNFDATIPKYEFLVVEFFAPWCPYCKRFAPEYKKAASEVMAKTDRIAFARVDITKERALTKRFNIRGIPVVHVFNYGKHMNYTLFGARPADTVKRWLAYKIGIKLN
jgi:protein disulfide-isomerase A1